MSAALQSVQLFLLAGALFLGVGTLSSALLIRALSASLSRWEPRVRHRALLLLAALPVLSALVLLLSATLPSLVSLYVPDLDHCLFHDDAHAHLCFVHLPTVSIHLAFLLGLVFVVSYALLRALLAGAGVWRALRVLNALARTGESRADLDVIMLDTTQPLCLAAGLFQPRVLLSRGLLESLSATERTIVLAHEQAHVRRRDALVASIVRALSVVHLPSVAGWLLKELEIAAEQTCDETAARVVGDRLAVASAILAVERAAQQQPRAQLALVAVAFGHGAVERRVESLLAEPLPARSLGWLKAGLVAAAIATLGITAELHHATESLLSFLAH